MDSNCQKSALKNSNNTSVKSCIKFIRQAQTQRCLHYPGVTELFSGDPGRHTCPEHCPFRVSGAPLEATPDLDLDCLHLTLIHEGIVACFATGASGYMVNCFDCPLKQY